jgi:hypothetical protein
MEGIHMEALLLPHIRLSHTDRLDMEGDLVEDSAGAEAWAEAEEDGKKNKTK